MIGLTLGKRVGQADCISPNFEGVAGDGGVLFFLEQAMSEPDAEMRFAEDVVDAIQAARLRGVDDETLIRLLGEIAAELREDNSTFW
jgi:hypothetical protein